VSSSSSTVPRDGDPKGTVRTEEQPNVAAEIPPVSVRARRFGAVDVPVQLGRVVVLIAGLAIWQLAVELGWVLELYAATPLETAERLLQLFGESTFWNNARITLQETASGWALGSSLGLITGLLLGRWRRAARVFDPYLTFMNATPKIAFAPFFILWFGIDQTSKVVLAATIVFFIVQVPTQAAVSMVQPDLDTVATTMGAKELQKFRMVVLPGIMPSVFGALRLALVYSLLAVVLGEFIAARAGLGQALITATNQFDMATAFSLLIVLATLAVLINTGLAAVERRFNRWQSADVRGKTVSM
jgi:NitT/TauT family transport system permease protein